MKRLVLAPHCDDETLGCGGLLAKYPDETGVVVVSTPNEVRLKEFEVAKEILGYSTACFLGLRDGNIGEDMHALVGLLDEVVAEFQPQELYLPFPSMHQDHIAAYEAGIRAGRLSMTDGHWFTPSLYVYDVAAYDVVLYPTDLKWNIFESLVRGPHRQEGRRPERLLVAGRHRPAPPEQHQAAGAGHRQRPTGRVGRAVRPRAEGPS